VQDVGSDEFCAEAFVVVEHLRRLRPNGRLQAICINHLDS
jgi:hypothetical protein